MPEPKTKKARATRERIVNEAVQLFSVKGYFHTTLDDVMAKVRLTKGGFYAHFDSKEALARTVVEHATQMWTHKVMAFVSSVKDPRDQLRALIEGYRRYAVDRTFEGGCFFVNLAVEMDDQHDEMRRSVEARFEQFRAIVASIVEHGKALGVYDADTPSESIATLVVSSLTGTMMLSKSSGHFDHFDASSAMIARLLSTYEKPRDKR